MKKFKQHKQQIAEQIAKTNQNIGRLIPGNTKYYSFGNEPVIPSVVDIGPVVRWRKKWFITQRSSEHYTPDMTDFISYVRTNGPILNATYIDSNTGGFSDRQIPQYSNVLYDIEVYRGTQGLIPIDIRCAKSIRIEIDNIVVLDSGDFLPNSQRRVYITIPGNKWTKIRIFFYSSSSEVSENSISISLDLIRFAEKYRIIVPDPPLTLTASSGGLLNSIKLDWTVQNQTDFQFYQLWSGNASNDINTLITSTIPSDQLTYSHDSISTSDHIFFKIRGITTDGEVSDFSPVAEGWAALTLDNFLTINPLPNYLIGNTETIGYYGDESPSNGRIFINVDSQQELISAPLLTVRDPNLSTIHTGVLYETVSANSWKYYVTSSGVDFNQGEATIYALSDTLLESSNIVVDKNTPIFGFSIDGDGGYPGTSDYFTRSKFTQIVITSYLDPNTNVYQNEFGEKKVAGIYQAKFANDSIGNLNSADWIDVSNQYNTLNWTLSNGTGLKVVYCQARDRTGNLSPIDSSTIYLATGNIQNVIPGTIVSGYDKFTINWVKSNYSNIAGYLIYRQVDDDTTPLSTSPAYAAISNATITSFTDIYKDNSGSILPFHNYYYWLKAYSNVGEISSGFSSPVISGRLRAEAPSADTRVTSGIDGINVYITLKNNASDDSDIDRRGYYHNIYRKDISYWGSPDSITNAVKINRIIHDSGSATTFTVYDVPPNGSSYFQYFSIAENRYGYTGGATPIPLSTGLRINDGPPSKPGWKTESIYAKHFGVHLTWTGGIQTDIIGYNLFREEGTVAGNPSSSPYKQITYDVNSITDPIFDDLKENIPVPTSKYTYWLTAYDTDGFISDFSNPLTTGCLTSAPPIPVWVSGESYAWYGYNHVTLSGLTDNDQALAGYKIYRSTGLDSNLATLITTINDDRYQGYKNSFDDFEIDYFKEYNYWCTSYNKYGFESSKSTILTGIGIVQPNYGEFFSNYLDNSSFERTFDNDNNWTIADSNAIKTNGSIFGNNYVRVSGLVANSLLYNGYIFIQPSRQYFMSAYVKKVGSPAANLIISGRWHDLGRNSQVGGFSIIVTGSSLGADWTRVSGGPFAAPSNALSATLLISSLANSSQYDVDAFQLEEYDSVKSPRIYTDSRTISADRMQAHVVYGDMLQFDSIEGNKIRANTISGREILASSITADKIRVPLIGNFIPNSSFEQVDPTYNSCNAVSGYGTVRASYWGLYTNNTNEERSTIGGWPTFTQVISDVTDTFYNAGIASYAPYGIYVLRKTASNPTNTWRSSLIPVVTGISYRLSTYYMINNSDLASTASVFIGIRAFDEFDDLVTNAGALANGWTYHSSSKTYYKDVISATASNRIQWLRTGYDLVITGASVKKVKVVFGTTNVSNEYSPLFYFDGVKLENSSFDSEYGIDVYTQIDGYGITTETVTTNNLAANSVTSTKIAADSVSAIHITSTTLDVGTVKLTSDSSEVNINGSGITIGIVSPTSSYSKFTKNRAEYIITGNVFNYAKRIETYENLGHGAFQIFGVEFQSPPKVILIPSVSEGFYAGFPTTVNHYLNTYAYDITRTGFRVNATVTSGTTGGADRNNITTAMLDSNALNMQFGDYTVNAGDTISNFQTNWLAYDNNNQFFNAVKMTLNCYITITGISSSEPTLASYPWNLQFIYGRPHGSTLVVSGVINYSGEVSYSSDYGSLPLIISKQAVFSPSIASTGYGFQIRLYQTDPDGFGSQRLFATGTFATSYYDSGGTIIQTPSLAKCTALVIGE